MATTDTYEETIQNRLISLRNIANILKPIRGVNAVTSKADAENIGGYDIRFKFNTGAENLEVYMNYQSGSSNLFLRMQQDPFAPQNKFLGYVAETLYGELKSSLPCETGSPLGMIDMGGFYEYTNVKFEKILDHDRTPLK